MARGKHPNSLANLKKHQVKPGEIKNPTGINRKFPWTERWAALGEKLLKDSKRGEKIRVEFDLPETATWADAIIFRTAIEGVMGNFSGAANLIDRQEGRAPQRIELSGPNRQILNIRITHDRKPNRDAIANDRED